MTEQSPSSAEPQPDLSALRAAIASGDPVQVMPALIQLRFVTPEEAVPLLVLGTQQELFLVRSFSCSGLGEKRTEEGWRVLSRLLVEDSDANVRAQAANALASYGVERSWPLLRDSFIADDSWLVRCSIMSALAEQPSIALTWLLELANFAVVDQDGTVRVSGAELLVRVLREGPADGSGGEARLRLQGLQQDPDHRVVAAVLNGLQS